jgi:hypothetical protein
MTAIALTACATADPMPMEGTAEDEAAIRAQVGFLLNELFSLGIF